MPRYRAICRRLNRQTDYDGVILTSLPNLKQFIRLRDSSAEFDNSANGYLGIPALLLPNGDSV